jgi:hypothetical protein
MGNPHPSSILCGERFIDYKVVGVSLKYSQASMETLQDNIVFITSAELVAISPSRWSRIYLIYVVDPTVIFHYL